MSTHQVEGVQDFDPDGLGLGEVVALADQIDSAHLRLAYEKGLFPWPHAEGQPIGWFSPYKRGVLFLDQFHVPTSFQKFLKKTNFRVTLNQCFPEVMKACAKQARPNQEGTWILPRLFAPYEELHRQGSAHSLEVWHEDLLVGGLYGVDIAGVFAGESMFFLKTGASKFALYHLVGFLTFLERKFIDVQMVTPVLESFGASYLNRSYFYKLLRREQVLDQESPLNAQNFFDYLNRSPH